MKTLAQLRTDVRSELFTDPNGRIWKEPMLTDYINQAYLKIQSDGQFLWDENEHALASGVTVSGTAEYTLPTDLIRIEKNGVKYKDNEIEETTRKDIYSRYSTASSGTPYCYYVRGGKIGFYPVPAGVDTYQILYLSKAPALAGDGDQIIYPDDFARAIVKYASYLAWSAPRGNRQEAEYKLTDYNRTLGLLLSSYQTKAPFDYNVQRNTLNNFNPKGLN